MYLKLQPFRHRSVHQRKNKKLTYKDHGPFKIKSRIGEYAYNLGFSERSQIHPTFLVLLLKRRIGSNKQPELKLPLMVKKESLNINLLKYLTQGK